jgi:uncharacterized membrane-anchored protein
MPTALPHPLPVDATTRRQLHDEVHARPVARIRIPALVTHLAVLHDGAPVEAERDHLRALVEACTGTSADSVPGLARAAGRGAHPMDVVASDPTFVQVALPDFTIKWERHGEFSLYSIIQPVDQEELLAAGRPDLLTMVPAPDGWLAGIPGRTLSALHVLLLRADGQSEERAAESAQQLLGPGRLYGSSVKEGSARLFTTYRLGPDGTSRFLLLCHDVTEGRTGRMTASLVEMETYRVLALQAFRPARALAATLPRVESRLADMTRALEAGSDRDEALLHDLIQLAAEVETDLAQHSTGFAATQAYFSIVQQRIDDLRGTSLPGLMGVFTFLSRRLLPAMATVEATSRRLGELSQRIDRAGDLLRTRVGITTEAQNQELLRSLGRGQRLQLRLQETVEGLSIAAITYYLVGLMGYGGKALKAAGLHLNPDVVTGVSVPVAAGAVWWTLRRVRARLHD